MSIELPATDTIIFSNTTVVRDQDGKLSVWVGNEKMMGVAMVQIAQDNMSLVIPMARVRVAEDVPATPVYETKDNVIQFTRFRIAQAAATVDETPTADGDSA